VAAGPEIASSDTKRLLTVILMRIKDPLETPGVNSLSTGTISVVKGSSAISTVEAGAVARKNMEWQAARIAFALTLDSFTPACKRSDPRVIRWVIWDTNPKRFVFHESS